MTVPYDSPSRTRSPWESVSHALGRRRREGMSPAQYDHNVRYVLEDIALQLARIADVLEGKKK